MCGEEHEILVSSCSSRSSTTSPKLLPAFFLVQPVTCCFVVKKIVIPKCSLFRTPISAVIFCAHGLFGDWVGLVDARWRRTGASLHPIDTSRWKTQSRNLFSCSCPVCAPKPFKVPQLRVAGRVGAEWGWMPSMTVCHYERW